MECEASPLPGPSGVTSCAASVASLTSTGSAAKQAEMVATLQARRTQLEAKLAAKNEELKMLCIQEAELTGILPPETPLEPGETPPTLRRRVGTSFTLPESLLNKLRSNEEESVAAVELEMKIQTGIAEAALGLANDNSASKQVRRKHRLMYQQSQRRLQDLETKLSKLREGEENQVARVETPPCAQPQQPTQQQKQMHQMQHQQLQQLKHRKKPRPIENDLEPSEIDGMLHAGGVSLSPLGQIDNRENRHSSALTASTNTVGLPLHPPAHRNSAYRYSTLDSSWTIDTDRVNRREVLQTGSGYWSNTANQETSSPGGTRYSVNRYPSAVHVDVDEPTRPHNPRWKRERVMIGMSRFGSLDRRRAGGPNSATVPGNSNHVDEVETGVPALLPSQTYPEHSLGHSLVRTQSLGSVEASRPRHVHSEREKDSSYTVDRKPKEKDWYETSLDAAPVLSPQGSQAEPPSQNSHPPLHSSLSHPQTHHHYQSQPQLHHGLHHSAVLPQSQSHSQLSHAPSHPQTHPPPFSPPLPQSQSHPQLHSQPPQLPPHLPPHHKLHAHSTQNIAPPPLPPHHSQAPALPPHSVPPPLPPHSSAHLGPPPIPPHSSSHIAFPSPHNQPPLPPPHTSSSAHHPGHSIPSNPAPSPHLPNAQPVAPSLLLPHHPPVSHMPHSPVAHTYSQPPAPLSLPSPQTDDSSSSQQVPLESPRNHMVVQAGSWQPYREVTKPFEMSDFYKYSTKFRKQMQQPPPSTTAPISLEGGPQSPQQQKGIYQPLQPLTCQPVEPQSSSRPTAMMAGNGNEPNVNGTSESLADAFSSEMFAWFQDQRAAPVTASAVQPSGPAPRSATLV